MKVTKDYACSEDDMARFMKYVEPDTNGGCWLWSGALAGPMRYGYFYAPRPRRNLYAHRVSYTYFCGEVDPELQIDHKCRVPQCVNPAHLEPVTQSENQRRAPVNMVTHCPDGHEYSAENTYIPPNGWRTCRECVRLGNKEAYYANLEKNRLEARLRQKAITADPVKRARRIELQRARRAKAKAEGK